MVEIPSRYAAKFCLKDGKWNKENDTISPTLVELLGWGYILTYLY